MQFYAINRPDNVQDAKDTVLISFNTQLLNLAASYNTQKPVPKAEVQFGYHTAAQTVALLVREPNIVNYIDFSTYNGDAMDIFKVTSSLQHNLAASTSAAYNLTVTIPLPWNVHLIDQSLVFYSNTSYSPLQNPTNTTADVQLVSGGNVTDQSVSFFIPFLGLGSTFSFSFSLIVDNHTRVDDAITLRATVSWFSLWPIHSETQAHAYSTSAAKTMDIDTPTVVNELVNTSLPETVDTNVNNGNVNIGEQLVYHVRLTFRVSFPHFVLFFI